ncbi:MAG: M60 family metallopeptidase [Clostridium perfringens]|nr:M60 family metallopeptidase [Clostridium perfringens]
MRKKRIFLLMIIASSCALCSPAAINAIQNNVVNEIFLANSSKSSHDLKNLTTTLTSTTSVTTLSSGDTKKSSSTSVTTSDTLSNQQIAINNVWSQALGSIGFNTESKTLTFTSGWAQTNPYYTGTTSLSITIYNSLGKEIKSIDFKGGVYPEDQLEEDLNGITFNYGDIIDITSNSNGNLSITNFNNESSYSMGSSLQVEITQNGLKDLSNTLKVNPIYFNINDKNITVTGTTIPNDLVNVWIGSNYYSVEANSDGEFSLPITLSSDPTPLTDVTVFCDNTGFVSTTLQLNKDNYGLQNQSLTLQGSWGGYYNVVSIGFNQFTNMLNIKSYGNTYFSGAPSSTAYTVTLYDSQGNVIKTETYTGSSTESDFINDWNNKSFSYGDYLKVVSNSLPMYLDNSLTNSSSKLSSSTAFYEITKNGLEEFTEPTTTVTGDTLNVSTYANSTITLEANGNSYTYKTNASGNAQITLPSGLISTTPIKLYVTSSSGVTTYPITVYENGTNTTKTYTFEMHRDGSISPSSPLATKGDCMTLTSYEPIPIEYISKGEVSIDITGSNIAGTATLYVQDGNGLVSLGTIKTNTKTEIDVTTPGTLILDTGNIDLENANEFTQFNFNVNVSTLSGIYRQIPVFDNRTDCKVASFATNNSATFDNEINEGDNQNYGAIIIGDHVRIYVPYASSLGSNFNAANTVNWYNEAFVSDNELNGLSENATQPINRFHTNFFFVTTQNGDAGDGWFTGSGGTSCIPSMFDQGLTSAGWVMFHEVGHIFDPTWADSYLGCEVYSNMYTMDTQEKIQGTSTWLWGDSRAEMEDSKILPIYQSYYSGDPATNYIAEYSQGLYYFQLLQTYFPDYMPKINTLYREEVYNKDLPFSGMNFLPYAFAKLYHTNIIPSLDMWGYKVTNEKLIQYVIDNSTGTTNLVPKNTDFSIYQNTTVTPTMVTPTESGDKVTLSGIVNPNATVYVEYDNHTYNFTCNSSGVFTATFNSVSGENTATVYAKNGDKSDSNKVTVDINPTFDENNETFSINSSNFSLGNISLNGNNTLNFTSKLSEPNWESSTNSDFMTISLLNSHGEVIKTGTVTELDTMESIQNLLNGVEVQSGDIIEISSPKGVSGGSLSYTTVDSSSATTVKPISTSNGTVWELVVTSKGLKNLTPISVNSMVAGQDVLSGSAMANAKILVTANGKEYTTTTNSTGDFSVNIGDSTLGENISMCYEFGDNKSVSTNYIVQGLANYNLAINNVWKQALGTIGFNTNNMELTVNKGWSETNTYIDYSPFTISLESANGTVIKTLKADDGDWIAGTIYDTFNGTSFNYGDKIVIDYAGSSNIVLNHLINNSNIENNYIITKSETFEITKNGLETLS